MNQAARVERRRRQPMSALIRSGCVVIETAGNFLAAHRDKFDSIVAVPPSHQRALQPVIVLAEGIGAALQVPVLS